MFSLMKDGEGVVWASMAGSVVPFCGSTPVFSNLYSGAPSPPSCESTIFLPSFQAQVDWDAGPMDGANVKVLLLRHGARDSGLDMSFDIAASPECMSGLAHVSFTEVI
ncbi:hypothetical protein Tco_0572450 [Tanacetum coccineum]